MPLLTYFDKLSPPFMQVNGTIFPIGSRNGPGDGESPGPFLRFNKSLLHRLLEQDHLIGCNHPVVNHQAIEVDTRSDLTSEVVPTVPDSLV